MRKINLSLRNFRLALLIALCPLFAAGCGHHREARVYIPPAPSIQPSSSQEPSVAQQTPAEARPPHSGKKISYSEVGWASWYGPSYNHRRAANGEIYEQNGLTAAHRTLPLNSVARVTNLATGESVVVRITDRGPFVGNRIIDLSMGAAKKIGVYIHGTAKVRIDVLEAPAPIDSGGRWAVQMGAFNNSGEATKVKQRLVRTYRDARVLQFEGPRRDWWVRVLVPNGNKREAEEVTNNTRVPEGAVFLVRLD